MSVPIRDAATVLALRDGATGIEVFMVKRDSRLTFLGGAYVFPGGAADEADRDERFEQVLTSFDAEETARALDLDDPTRARAYMVAALRELFEEAGILLARSDGCWIALDGDDPRARRIRAERPRVAAGEAAFIDLLIREELSLAADCLHHFAHWITPEGAPRRFDTHFFVAPMPEGQDARHDMVESVDGMWVSPGDALASYARKEIELVPPTIVTLDRLALHGDTGEVLEAAATLEVIPVWPKISVEEDDVTILYPGDADYNEGVVRPGEPGKVLNRLVLRDGIWGRP